MSAPVSKRLAVVVCVMAAVGAAVCATFGKPVGALIAVAAAGISLWSVSVTMRSADQLLAIQEGGKVPRLALFLSVVLKLPLVGLVTWAAMKTGPVALAVCLVLFVSVYSAFVWDVVAPRRAS